MSSLGGAAGADQDGAAVAVGSQKPLGQEDRHCFICLQDEDKDNPLVPCCSTCFARTHVRCWREWRNNQRMTALRSRLLGLRTQTNHLLRCTICKSGTAMLAGEEDGLEWMNDLLSGGDAGDSGPGGAGPGAGGGMRRGGDDSDEDDGEGQLEDLIDVRTCVALVTYLAVLIVVLTVAIGLVMLDWFYAGDVVLCSIIALYELSVLLIVALAVARRRSSMLAAAEAALSLLGAGSGEGSRAGGADDDSTPRALESGDLRRTADSSPAEAGARRASWLQMAAWEHEASV